MKGLSPLKNLGGDHPPPGIKRGRVACLCHGVVSRHHVVLFEPLPKELSIALSQLTSGRLLGDRLDQHASTNSRNGAQLDDGSLFVRVHHVKNSEPTNDWRHKFPRCCDLSK